MPFQEDVQIAKHLLKNLPTHWDGKASIHRQGRNSNSKSRPTKYMLEYDEDTLSKFLIDNIPY